MADPITLAVTGVGVAVALTQLGQAVYKGHKDDKQNRKMLQMIQQNNVYDGSHMIKPATQPTHFPPNTHTLAISHQTVGRQSTFTSPEGWFVSVGHGPEARSSGTFITQTTSYGSAFPTSRINPNSHGAFRIPASLPPMANNVMLPIEHTPRYTTGRVVELPQQAPQWLVSYPTNHAPLYPPWETSMRSKNSRF